MKRRDLWIVRDNNVYRIYGKEPKPLRKPEPHYHGRGVYRRWPYGAQALCKRIFEKYCPHLKMENDKPRKIKIVFEK